MSARGKCQECAEAMIHANIEGLKTSSGPFFEYWRYRCADTFRYVLLDETPHGR